MNKAYSRQAVHRAFKEAGDSINKNIGTHTMRKTMGYMMHKGGVPIENICKMFNHSHPSITMRYIGLEQEMIDDLYTNFEIGNILV